MKVKKKAKVGNGASAKGIQWVISVAVVLLVVLGCGVLYVVAQRNADTVSVVMWATNNYKNGQVTSSNVQEYKMQRGEFENYALDTDTGSTRRLVLWDDVDSIYGCFCTRNVYAGTLLMIEDLMYSRIDNSDMIMYNFPGREIITLDVANDSINEFKTFLQPGDTINVTAIVSESRELVAVEDGNGGNSSSSQSKQGVEVIVTEPLFDNVYVADMLNAQGESVLDLQVYYNSLSVSSQAKLDSSEDWKERTTAQTILVALTKEEILRYYEYVTKSGVEFRISLPQR